jgi:hypothetical protein
MFEAKSSTRAWHQESAISNGNAFQVSCATVEHGGITHATAASLYLYNTLVDSVDP